MLLADEQVTTVSSAGNVLWALADHLGTIRDIADYNEGSPEFDVSNHRVYDSFGRLESETNSAVDLSFGFTGKYTDPDTGYTQHLFRWYDPSTGRWLSDDPLGFAAGDANLSRYVGNEAVGHVDPMGLFEQGLGYDGFAATETKQQDGRIYDDGGDPYWGGSVVGDFIQTGPFDGCDPEWVLNIGGTPTHAWLIDRWVYVNGGMTQEDFHNRNYLHVTGCPWDEIPRSDPNAGGFWDGVQNTLDWAGFAGPVGPVADGTNAIISLVRGDLAGFGLNIAAIIPIWGDGVKATKMTQRALRGMNNPTTRAAAEQGQKVHREFRDLVAEKPGWYPGPFIKTPDGKILKPDALDPKGRPIELKPDTPSGRRKGARQLKAYEAATGKRGRLILYDPHTGVIKLR